MSTKSEASRTKMALQRFHITTVVNAGSGCNGNGGKCTYLTRVILISPLCVLNRSKRARNENKKGSTRLSVVMTTGVTRPSKDSPSEDCCSMKYYRMSIIVMLLCVALLTFSSANCVA